VESSGTINERGNNVVTGVNNPLTGLMQMQSKVVFFLERPRCNHKMIRDHLDINVPMRTLPAEQARVTS
jgi:hypothetical protein